MQWVVQEKALELIHTSWNELIMGLAATIFKPIYPLLEKSYTYLVGKWVGTLRLLQIMVLPTSVDFFGRPRIQDMNPVRSGLVLGILRILDSEKNQVLFLGSVSGIAHLNNKNFFKKTILQPVCVDIYSNL